MSLSLSCQRKDPRSNLRTRLLPYWEALPSPSPSTSRTTDGVRIHEPVCLSEYSHLINLHYDVFLDPIKRNQVSNSQRTLPFTSTMHYFGRHSLLVVVKFRGWLCIYSPLSRLFNSFPSTPATCLIPPPLSSSTPRTTPINSQTSCRRHYCHRLRNILSRTFKSHKRTSPREIEQHVVLQRSW